VRQSETINFLLSSRGHNRIEGAGEVVWTNEMKTVCGLRFTSLSADARDYLNNWTNESCTAAAVRKKTVSPTPIAIVQAEEPPNVVEPQMDAEAESILAIRRAAENYLFEPGARSMWREPIFLRVMFGILSTVLAVTAFVYGVRVGKSETRSMAEPAAQPAAQPGALSDSQPTPQAPETAVPSTTAPANSSSTSAIAPAVSSQPASGQNDLSIVPSEKASNLRGAFVNASKTDGITQSSFDQPGDAGLDAKTPEQQAEVGLEAGKTELAAAQAFLRGTNGARDSAKAARLLWAAVKNNNSTAEVILADLYLRGDGVVKSCEQGRVLLEAASRSGNAQANEKLGELEATGCP
jgi:hypothetical protein